MLNITYSQICNAYRNYVQCKCELIAAIMFQRKLFQDAKKKLFVYIIYSYLHSVIKFCCKMINLTIKCPGTLKCINCTIQTPYIFKPTKLI